MLALGHHTSLRLYWESITSRKLCIRFCINFQNSPELLLYLVSLNQQKDGNNKLKKQTNNQQVNAQRANTLLDYFSFIIASSEDTIACWAPCMRSWLKIYVCFFLFFALQSFTSRCSVVPYNYLRRCSLAKVFCKMHQIYMRTPMPKDDFNKVAKQVYWNRTSALMFSCKFSVYFQKPFPEKSLEGCFCGTQRIDYFSEKRVWFSKILVNYFLNNFFILQI